MHFYKHKQTLSATHRAGSSTTMKALHHTHITFIISHPAQGKRSIRLLDLEQKFFSLFCKLNMEIWKNNSENKRFPWTYLNSVHKSKQFTHIRFSLKSPPPLDKKGATCFRHWPEKFPWLVSTQITLCTCNPIIPACEHDPQWGEGGCILLQGFQLISQLHHSLSHHALFGLILRLQVGQSQLCCLKEQFQQQSKYFLFRITLDTT